MCTTWINTHPPRLGGPHPLTLQPIFVEIDETKYFHRKYARGQWHNGHWVLGGVERNNPKNAFPVKVPNRAAPTLLPITEQYVDNGSMIRTDQWTAYNNIPNLHGEYGHITVNHRENFINPNDPNTYTQVVEGFWTHAKKKIKRMNGTSREMFVSYLGEFTWKWRKDTYQHGDGKAFQHILITINEQYPM